MTSRIDEIRARWAAATQIHAAIAADVPGDAPPPTRLTVERASYADRWAALSHATEDVAWLLAEVERLAALLDERTVAHAAECARRDAMTRVVRTALRRMVAHLEYECGQGDGIAESAWDDYHAARMYVSRTDGDWDSDAAESAHQSIRAEALGAETDDDVRAGGGVIGEAPRRQAECSLGGPCAVSDAALLEKDGAR